MLNKRYRTVKSQVVSLSWTDIASGTGYATFYGSSAQSNKVLSAGTIYSEQVGEDLVTDNGENYTKIFDHDYDVQLNYTRRVFGKAYVNVTGIVDAGSDNPKTFHMYFIAKLRKYDGTTETEIASGTSATYSNTTDGSTHFSHVFNIEVDVTTETIIKKGEYLRLTIEMYVKQNAAAGNLDFSYAHDPKDRKKNEAADGGAVWTGADSTVLRCEVPAKLTL